MKKSISRYVYHTLAAMLVSCLAGLLAYLGSLEAGDRKENDPIAQDDNRVSEEVTTLSATDDEYDKLRRKWKEMLAGVYSYDSAIAPHQKYGMKLAQQVTNPSGTGVWDTMTFGDPDGLWPDLQSPNNSRQMSEHFNRLRTMALAYSVPSSPLYGRENLGRDIIAGMNWMNDHRFNHKSNMDGNWWEWQIGAPKAIKDILVLMYDEMPPDLLQDYLSAIRYVLPDPTRRTGNGIVESGANLVDKALIAAVEGVLSKDPERIAAGKAALEPVFVRKFSGDGFYPDGSFIQHTNVPYVGSYGVVMIDSLSLMLHWLDGSRWAPDDLPVHEVSSWFRHSFDPLMVEGGVMDMVRGRAISRQGSDSYTVGRSVMISFLRMAELLPEKEAQDLKSRLKYWYQIEGIFPDAYMGLGIYDIELVRKLLEDSGIEPRKGYSTHRQYPYMDRVVHRRPDFAFGVSMYSSRILNYESMYEENKKGWYTGSGMTYLYNSDLTQYTDGYWPTVDPVRLPGVTTDGVGKPVHLSEKDWAGGVSLMNQYGTAGMEFAYPDSGLTGKKSWFMFDDEIVALGSDISGSTSQPVQTVIENRKIRDQADNRLLINGEEQPITLGWKESFDDVRWAHLEGNVPGAEIGYVFPEKSDITALRRERWGSWKELNRSQSKEKFSRNYVLMWFDHGTDPEGARYSYVILPGKTPEETKAYSEKPDVEIVRNNNQVHAVREKKLGILAANFWERGWVSFVRADQPSAVILMEKDNQLTISVSDPTQQQKSLTILVDRPGYRLVNSDWTMQVNMRGSMLEIKVDTSALDGRSHEAVFTKDETASS